jgi:hypothetical protein
MSITRNTWCFGPIDTYQPTDLQNYRPTADELYETVGVTGRLVLCSCVLKSTNEHYVTLGVTDLQNYQPTANELLRSTGCYWLVSSLFMC